MRKLLIAGLALFMLSPLGSMDDYDTGGGVDNVRSQGIALPASGGHVIGGTTTNPVVVDSATLTATAYIVSPIDGGTEATAVRVTVANDSTGLLSVDDNGGALSVDDAAGKLTVDWNGTDPPIGAGTEATALKVTVATDSTGVLSVDDNGSSLTIDNADITSTLAEAVTIKTNTGTIAGDTTSIDGKIANGGGAEAGAVLVTVANDSTGLLSVDDNGGSLTVDGTVAVSSPVTIASPVGGGTEAAAVRVTVANDSTGVLSVDDNAGSLSVDDAAGKLTVDWNGTDPPIGGGTEATALKVTVANDSTGVLSVDDNGSTLTVDGTVAATQSGNWDINDISAGTQTNDVKVTMDGEDVTVVGDAADGAAVSGNPVLMAGQDGTNAQSLKTDNTGALQVDVEGPLGGGAEAGAVLVTLANDSTGLVSVDDNGSSISVDDAGGDLSVDWAGTAPPIGAGTEATALRCTIATDSTGVLSVDDNGSTLSIDDGTGNISIDDGGNDISVDWAGTAPPIGAGTEAAALRCTIATDSTGVLSVDDGGSTISVDGTDLTNISSYTQGAETAVEIMDDWDAVSGSAAATDGPQVMGLYDSTKPTAVDDGDAVQILTDSYGRPLAGFEPEAFQATITSADATSATQVKAKTAAKKMYILSIIVSTDTAMNIQFQDDTGPTVLIEQMYFAANTGFTMTFSESAPLVVNTNEDLDIITSVAGNVSVVVTGYLAP
jgi:hypothetical protein